MGLRNDLIRLEHSATKASDKQDGDFKKIEQSQDIIRSKSVHARNTDIAFPRYQ